MPVWTILIMIYMYTNKARLSFIKKYNNYKMNYNKRPRGLDVCQQHCKKSAINVSGNVYLYSKMHYHEKMYILYIAHWHLYYYVRFP